MRKARKFVFNPEQRDLIQKIDVPSLIELFSLDISNVADFLFGLKKQPKEIRIPTKAFQLCMFDEEHIHVKIHQEILRILIDGVWHPAEGNYRILGVYVSEHLGQDPFLFLERPLKQKPKISIIDLFFEMSLTEIGKTSVGDLLEAEVIPRRKQLALKQALDNRRKRRQYTVGEIFTQMPLSRVGNLTLSEFFGAQVVGKHKMKGKL